jgi:hypothetical protein
MPSGRYFVLFLAPVVGDVATDNHTVHWTLLIYEAAEVIEKLAALVLIRVPSVAVSAEVDIGQMHEPHRFSPVTLYRRDRHPLSLRVPVTPASSSREGPQPCIHSRLQRLQKEIANAKAP